MSGGCRAALLLLLLPGCAATSGRAWLEAPLEPRANSAASATDVVPPDERPQGRPRLRETVTLGESYEAARPPNAPAPTSGPIVQVTVNNHLPAAPTYPAVYAPSYGYGYAPAYGYARGHASSAVGAPVRGSGSAPQKVGGDFPPPPDFGPRALR